MELGLGLGSLLKKRVLLVRQPNIACSSGCTFFFEHENFSYDFMLFTANNLLCRLIIFNIQLYDNLEIQDPVGEQHINAVLVILWILNIRVLLLARFTIVLYKLLINEKFKKNYCYWGRKQELNSFVVLCRYLVELCIINIMA